MYRIFEKWAPGLQSTLRCIRNFKNITSAKLSTFVLIFTSITWPDSTNHFYTAKSLHGNVLITTKLGFTALLGLHCNTTVLSCILGIKNTTPPISSNLMDLLRNEADISCLFTSDHHRQSLHYGKLSLKHQHVPVPP